MKKPKNNNILKCLRISKALQEETVFMGETLEVISPTQTRTTSKWEGGSIKIERHEPDYFIWGWLRENGFIKPEPSSKDGDSIIINSPTFKGYEFLSEEIRKSDNFKFWFTIFSILISTISIIISICK